MKKFLGVMLSFVMAFSLFGFVGCDSSAPDLSALEKKIAALEDKLNKVEKDNAALEDKLNKVEKDNAALEDKLSKVPDYKAEIDVLKGTVANLAELIKNLGSDNSSLTNSVDKLKADVAGFETRIAMLESLQMGTAEQKIYTVCEDSATTTEKINTYTFVNNNTGAKLFSVKLTKWFLNGIQDYALNVTIENFSIPSCVPLDTYLSIYAYKDDTYYKASSKFDHLINIGDSFTRMIMFDNGDKATHFIIGIPTQDPTKQSIIPYATFKL